MTIEDRPSPEAAWSLVCDWVASPSLRRHMLAVATAMRAYAERFDEDVELWGLCGLLHDIVPTTPVEKTLVGVDELRGFIVACVAVRPNGIAGLTAKSVQKKLQTASFAASVNREEIAHGAWAWTSRSTPSS